MSNGYKYIALQERHFSGAEYLYLSKPACDVSLSVISTFFNIYKGIHVVWSLNVVKDKNIFSQAKV